MAVRTYLNISRRTDLNCVPCAFFELKDRGHFGARAVAHREPRHAANLLVFGHAVVSEVTGLVRCHIAPRNSYSYSLLIAMRRL